MDFHKFFLYIALALVLMLIWQAWLEEQRPVAPVATDTPATPTPAGAVPAVAEALPAAPEVGTESAPPAAETAPAGPAPVVVTTDLMRIEIDRRGADPRTLALLGYPVTVDEPDRPFVLLKNEPREIFTTQTGLIGGEYPNHTTLYRADQGVYQLATDADELVVPLYWSGPGGVEYVKRFRFRRDSYHVDVEYEVANNGGSPWRGFLYSQFVRTQPESSGGFFGRLPSYTGAAIYTPEDRYDKIDFGEMEDQDLAVRTQSGWVAMLQHYFVGAWLPQPGTPAEYYSKVLPRPAAPQYVVGYKTLEPTDIEPGASGTLGTRIYLGPKEQDRLKQSAEGLVLTVDYGWLTPISSPLFWILNHIHRLIGNWGWAIILLTVLIKLVFFPLSAASYKSMARMKTMQPRLKTLKERYGDDKQRLNQAMMELYKKEKINPLGGCLPILVQIPVFIALYWVLLESVELRQAPWALWIRDLSVPDPFYVLPILMGASMLAQHFLNPSPLDPIQKNIMMAMPIVFTVFFLWFPAGLVLYWLVNNVLSIAQQWYITRKIVPAKAT